MRRLFSLLCMLCALGAYAADTNTYNMLDNTLNASSTAPVSVVTNQTVAYTTISGQSAAVSASTRFITITCTTDCFALLGSSPAATSSNLSLPAWSPSLRLSVTPGTTKVGVIRSTQSGSAYIAEYAQ